MKTDARLVEFGERVIEALRGELHQYAAMLSLLDQQQQAVIGRAADDVLQAVVVVNEQTQSVERARQGREACRRDLATLLCKPEDSTFAQLVPGLPQKFHAGIDALIRENNELLTRVRQRARQNHVLISRSLELMQRVLNAFVPSASQTVYTEAGKTVDTRPAVVPLYEAVG